jgi:hypothetical protein
MVDVRTAAERLREHGAYLFFKHDRHFCNPLVEEEWQQIELDPSLRDPSVQRVLEDELLARLPDLVPGIYSPVPIARAMSGGVSAEAALQSFRYEMVVVDDRQEWWWQGKPVAARLKPFFVEHLSYEPDLGLYYFEYRVSDDWYDKCYLIGAMTPMLGTAIHQRSTVSEEHRADLVGLECDSPVVVTLNNGKRDLLSTDRFRLDEQERLFAQSCRHGEVLLSPTTRFQLLEHVSEDLSSLDLFGCTIALRDSW